MQKNKAQVAILQAMFLDAIYKHFMWDMRDRVTNIYIPKPCPKINQEN